jgi:exonuclease SbcC
MSFKLKKLFISNFKCIKDTRILDLTQTSLFSGPNGFGKTTIFDALEICFTGNLNRFENYQCEHKSNTFEQAFYQNEKDLPTVLKVLLEVDNKAYTLILQHAPSGKSGPTNMSFSRWDCCQS